VAGHEVYTRVIWRQGVRCAAAVSLSVSRGRRIALENHYEIGNL